MESLAHCIFRKLEPSRNNWKIILCLYIDNLLELARSVGIESSREDPSVPTELSGAFMTDSFKSRWVW